MKTHLPTGLRKALIAAIFAVSAVAYNAQANDYTSDASYGYIDDSGKGYNEDVNVYGNAHVTTTTGGVHGNGVFVSGHSDLTSRGTVSSTKGSYWDNGSLRVTDHSSMTVQEGSATAQDGMTVQGHSTLTVENGNVSADGVSVSDYAHLSVTDGSVTSSSQVSVSDRSDLTITDGSLVVQNDADVSVTDNSSITVTRGNVTVGGDIIVNGEGSVEDVYLSAAEGSVQADAVQVREAALTSGGGVTATDGNIEVKDGSLTASGAVKAANAVSLTGAEVAAGEVQAMGGDLSVSGGSELTTEGAVTAARDVLLSGSTAEADTVTAERNITIANGNLTADTLVKADGALKVTDSSLKGSAAITTAGEDGQIIRNSTVEGASLTASKGNIIIETADGAAAPSSVKLTGAVTATEGHVYINGTAGLHSTAEVDSVTAEKFISIEDSDVTVHTLIKTNDNFNVRNGSLKGTADIVATGEETAVKYVGIKNSVVEAASLTAVKGDIAIITTAGAATSSAMKLTGDLTAAASLTITDAEVQVGGKVQTGTHMTVNGGSLVAEGNVTAHDDITAADADLGAANLTSETGSVSVTNGSLSATGNVSAKENITLTDTDATVAGNVSAEGSVSVTKGSLEAANLTADKGIAIDNYARVVVNESLSTVGGTAVDPSVTTVNNHSSLTVEKDMNTEGLTVTDDSTVEVGDTLSSAGTIAVSSTNGSLKADDIITTEGGVTVSGGAEVAAAGTIAAKEGLSVSGTESAVSAKDITIADGDIAVTDGATLKATGDIKATVADPGAAAEVLVSGAGSSLSATTLAADKVTIADGAALEAETVTVTDVLALDKAIADISIVEGDLSAKETNVEVDHVTGKVTAVGSEIAVEHTIGGGVDAAQDSVIVADRVEGTVYVNDSDVTVSGAITDNTSGPADITIVNDGAVSADSVSIMGDIAVSGTSSALTVEDAIKAEDISVTDGGTIEALTITAETLAVSNDGTVKVEDTITADITGDGGTVIAAGTADKGLTINGDVESDSSTYLTQQDSSIAVNGNLTGENNLFGMNPATQETPASDIRIAGDISGNLNELYANGNLLPDGVPTILVGHDLAGDANTLEITGDGDLFVQHDVSGIGNDLLIDGDGDLNIDHDLSGDGNGLTISGDGDLGIDHDLSGSDNELTIGGDGDISVGNNLSGSDNELTIEGNGDITVDGEISANGNELSITGDGDIVVYGAVEGDTNKFTIAGYGDVSLLDDLSGGHNTVTVKGDGNISLSDDITGDGNKMTVEGNGNIFTDEISGDSNTLAVAGDGDVRVGDITGDSNKLSVAGDGDVVAEDISGDGNTLSTEGEGDITVGTLGDSLTPAADNELTAAKGDITITELADNTVLQVTATEGTVTVTNDSAATLTASDIEAKKDITIGGDSATPAMLTLTDGTTVSSSAGNVTLDQNVTVNGSSIEATAGKVTFAGGSNTITNGATVTAGDTIDVAEGTTLNMGAGSANALVGKLSGAGTVSAQQDNLNLSHDGTAFTGLIDMGNGKTLTISDEGVGADATINLTGSDTALVVTAAGASLGHVTANPGSEIALNPGTADGTATAGTLTMGNDTTLHIDADATSADCITVTEGVSITTPGTVYVNDQTALEDIKGDVKHTIIKLADGAVNNGVDEAVRYDMTGGRRELQGKNMSLVSTKDGVQLVISTNFRGTEKTNANQGAVNSTLKELSAAADHTPGHLAGMDSDLAHVMDALDNTRSEAATLNALQSLSAAGNLVVPNMMMDSTRHHLSTLRSHMGAPTCTDKAGSIKKGGNAWAVYTGGHDAINGDVTGDYTRTHQGALIGSDYSVNCSTSVGVALGYESSIGRMDGVRADADTMFADLYTTVRTGAYTHRISAGVALHDIDTKRHVGIAAGGHTYTGSSTGSMDAVSWNLGYEISRSMKLSEASTLTPFAAIDVAFHQLDTLNETGMGDACVTTDFDEPVQVDVALGAAYTRTFRSFTADSSVLSVSAAIHGELSKHRPTADNHFVGGGHSWKTRSSERTPIYGEIGASVAVPVYKTTSLIGGGNFEFSEDRVSVGGNIGVNVKF